MWLIGVTLAFGAVGAGYLGWHLETRKLYRRGGGARPAGMDPQEYERSVLRKRKRRRLIKSTLYGLGGAVVGFCLLMALALRR